MSSLTDKPSDLSDEYWERLSPHHRAMYALVRPEPRATHTVDYALTSLEDFISSQTKDMAAMGGIFELEPDFQRGHVWTDEQRVRYVESLIRGTAPRTIKFNCPGWQLRGSKGDIPGHTFQCIDGLQRLTAARKFMAGEFTVFGGFTALDFKRSPFDPARIRLQFEVYEIAWRQQLLQFYLDLNRGGTVHDKNELDRVQALLEAAIGARVEAPRRTVKP